MVVLALHSCLSALLFVDDLHYLKRVKCTVVFDVDIQL